ncbi:MAG: hypothetical protein QG632_566 [Candidatus Dependentiae bacterium]|nr:hypothetical protein [Candidatus Dependentiae bacterium]
MLYSEREVTMATILEQVICGKISPELGTIKLKISKRTVYRKIKKYQGVGLPALIHGNRGRESRRKIPETTWTRIEETLRNELADFGPTHAQEKLAQEPYNLLVSAESLRKRMRKIGLPIKKAAKPQSLSK